MIYPRELVLEKIQPFLLLYPTTVEYCVGSGSLHQICIFYQETHDDSHEEMWINWLNSVDIQHQWKYGTFLTILIERDDFTNALVISGGGPYYPA